MSSFLTYVGKNFPRIAALFLQHVQVVLIAVFIATVISLGIVIGTRNYQWLRQSILSVAATMLTIPSFALFALMIPVLGLGAAPTIVALVFYAIFPILRNMITGIDGVAPQVIDAAAGMGMGPWHRFWKIQIPLSWPVVLNGIRVATIVVVATAAIGAAVRGPGLGELIFRGLARMGGANALNEALTGVIGVVAVAAILDLLFQVIGKLTTPRGLHV